MKVSLYLLFLGIELCLGQPSTETCALTVKNTCTEKGGTCNKCKQDLFTHCKSHKNCNPNNEKCKCSVNCKLNDEQCKKKNGTCINYKKCNKFKKWFVCDKNMCGEGSFPKKYCACKYYKNQELCPQDLRCAAMEEGECMKNKHCKQYAKKFPGYSCSKEKCKGKKCSCKYKEQPCKDNGCEKKEGECMTKEACYNGLDPTSGYTCSKELCEGDDCVCKYNVQPCKDNGCEKKEGECMTKEACYNGLDPTSGYTCSKELCEGDDCVCKYKEQPLCIDNGCKKKEEGKCMTLVECDEYARKHPGFSCSGEFCKGSLDSSDCVCSYYEQPFCEDIRCQDQEGKCMTKEECDNFVTSNEGFFCTDKLCQGKDCVCMKPTKGSSSNPNPEVKKRNVI